MFAQFFHLFTGRSTPRYEQEFVREVRVVRRRPRSVRATRWLLGGWGLIALKCWAVVWAVEYYHVPVNPLWVTAPTVAFAGVCTWLFFRGE